MKVKFGRDWNEFLSAMISHHARFVLVGGHALAVHAEPRFTEDLDVFVEVSPENARRLRAALLELGFGELSPSVEELTVPGRIWMLGRKPHRIDILTEISGVSFDEAWRSRIGSTSLESGCLSSGGLRCSRTSSQRGASSEAEEEEALAEQLGGIPCL